jgi:hypothetical protein
VIMSSDTYARYETQLNQEFLTSTAIGNLYLNRDAQCEHP